ncbi:LysR family transcriptional regulator [Paraferrimonas sedimenticola]|uniref:LysR family transcriptional regulator n=1 Tax=Paraferrimonas sedimenticola TaxID=375674 RepID=A0AA37S0B9_9GAMM|nr:LysR family transcriptional regulator [Paraferrimonas sedimenticola]GLP98043.1 LysR family transcriptional regulator [Paraferrimonas sedimenticola]
MNFSLPQLEAFVATAECGSFKGAAIKLDKRSQTISSLVASLEDCSDQVLFERKAKSLCITEVGRQLYASAKRVMGDAEKLASLIESIDACSVGKLTLAIDSFLHCKQVIACCSAVKAEYPDIEITVLVGTTHEVTQWVQERKADIGLRLALVAETNQLTLVSAFSFNLLYIAPASLFRHGQVVSREQLQSLPQIVYDAIHDIEFDDSYLVSDQLIVTNNVMQNISLIEEGLGWCVMADIAVQANLDTRDLVEVSMEGGQRDRWMAECVYCDEVTLSLPADVFLQRIMALS